jgi:uncharacterized Tic20 family protein
MLDATSVTDMAQNGGRSGNEATPAPADQWTAAAMVHLTVLLTLVLSVVGGIGALIGLGVTLVIYFAYREKSRFVAFHALQSFIYQVAGIVLYALLVAVLAVWVVIAWTVSGVLSAVLVGMLMMPFALLLTLVLTLVSVCTPLAWLGYGLFAAYQVYQGCDFRYWLIGEKLEQEMRW